MSDFSPILVLQIKICIKPDRHGKGSNKIWETLSFWRNFSNYASLWRFLLRCTLFCHSVATFLTSVSSYEGGCGFEVFIEKRQDSQRNTSHICRKSHILWDNSLIFCIADDFCKFFDAMMEKYTLKADKKRQMTSWRTLHKWNMQDTGALTISSWICLELSLLTVCFPRSRVSMYNVQLIHSFHCFEFIELTLEPQLISLILIISILQVVD